MYAITLLGGDQKPNSSLQKKPTEPTVNLISLNLDDISFSIQINGIVHSEKKTDSITYDCITIPSEDVMTDSCSPQLPVVTKLIAIPDCDNISISVSPSNEAHFYNYNILPAPTYETKKFPDGSEDLNPKFEENKSIYSQNIPFPGKYGEILETGYIRNQKIARIAVYPVQYIPASKEIIIYSEFDIKLSFVNPKSSVNKELGVFRKIIHSVALNYKPGGKSALTKLSGSIQNKNNKSEVTSLGSVTRVTNLSTLTGENAIPVDYLIITHSSLFNSGSLTKLANHRKDYNGYDVAIVKVNDDVYNSYPSAHRYESIRDFIQDVYLHGKASHIGDGHLGYILLVGDAYLDDNSTEMLPAAYPSFYDKLEQAGDYYYACTGGDSDNLLDLMYGRLPVGNETELNNVVNKIISYEYNTNGSWRNNYTFVAGSYGLFYSYADLAITRMTQMIPQDWTKSYAYRALDSDRPTLVTSIDSILGQRFTLEEYKDLTKLCGSRKLSDWLYNDPVAGINHGVHTLIYEGHGSWNGLGGESCGRQIFKVEDCIASHDNTVENRLHNNLYTFMIFCACNTGHFDNGPTDEGDCIAEVVLNLQNRGAIGVIGSTRDSDLDSFGFVDGKILDKEINDSLFIIGEAFMESKISDFHIQFRRQYNLYSDPALNLWPVINNKTLNSNLDSTANQSIKKYKLFNNYPNPFNPSTLIRYQIVDQGHVILKVYNILGEEVVTLVNENQTPGIHTVTFNGSNCASGVYFYQLLTNSYSKVKKMLIIK